MDSYSYSRLKGPPPVKLLTHTALQSSGSNNSQSNISVLSAIRAPNQPVDISCVMTPMAVSKPAMKQVQPFQMINPEVSMNKEQGFRLNQNVTSPLHHTLGSGNLLNHESPTTLSFNQNVPSELLSHNDTFLPDISSVQAHRQHEVSQNCNVHFIQHGEPLNEFKEAKKTDSTKVSTMKDGIVEKKDKYKVHYLETVKSDKRGKKRKSKRGAEGGSSLTECSCPDMMNREEIPEEQVFVVEGQMYRLPEAYVIHIGHLQLYTFVKDDSLFVPLVSLTSCLDMPTLKQFNEALYKHKASLFIADMFENDCKLIRQKCHLSFPRHSKYMIEFSSIRALANVILQSCDNLVMDCLVSEPVMLKVASSKVLCSQCGSVISTTNQMDHFVDISMETSLLGHPIVLEDTLNNDKTRKCRQSQHLNQQCTRTSAINRPISTHLEPGDAENVTSNGSDNESITKHRITLSDGISQLQGEKYTAQNTEIFTKCYVKEQLQEPNTSTEGFVNQLPNKLLTNETCDTIKDSRIGGSAELMKTKSSDGQAKLLENVNLPYNYKSQGSETQEEFSYEGAEMFGFDESVDLLDLVCPDELELTQRTSESSYESLFTNEGYIVGDFSAFESVNADNRIEVVSKNNSEQERTFEIFGKSLVPDKIDSIDKQKNLQKNDTRIVKSTNINHAMSSANGCITSPASCHITSPINGVITSSVNGGITLPENGCIPSPANGHKTSPANDQITLPANGCITSPASCHKTSPVTGLITSPANNHITSPVNDHITLPANDHITLPANGHITSHVNGKKTSSAKGHTTSPANDHITSPVNDHITSPANSHITSPVNDHITSPANDHKTSPANGHITSPANDHITSPANGHKTSPVNDHITSPANGHKTSPVNDHKTSPVNGHITSPANDHITSPANGHKTSLVNGHKTSQVIGKKTSPANGNSAFPLNGHGTLSDSDLTTYHHNAHITSQENDQMTSLVNDHKTKPVKDHIKSPVKDHIKSYVLKPENMRRDTNKDLLKPENMRRETNKDLLKPDNVNRDTNKDILKPENMRRETNKDLLKPENIGRDTNKDLLKPESMRRNTNKDLLKPENMRRNTNKDLLKPDNVNRDTNKDILKPENMRRNTNKDLLKPDNVNRDTNKDILKLGKKGRHSDAEHRAMEEKIKKYVVFVPRRNGFQVKRFKEGAEHAFPALFSPHPDYHMTKDRRRRFSIAASCWMSAMVKRLRREQRPEHFNTVNRDSMLMLKRKALEVPCFVQIKRLKFLDKLFE